MPRQLRLFGWFPIRFPDSPVLTFWCRTKRGTGNGNVPLMRVIWSEPTLATENPRPTLAADIQFRLVGPVRRFKDVPPDRRLDAAYPLYEAWPGGKGRNERAEICFEALDTEVVATAFWNVLRGMAPPQAIRRAFTDPVPPLATPRSGRSALLVKRSKTASWPPGSGWPASALTKFGAWLPFRSWPADSTFLTPPKSDPCGGDRL